LLADNKSFSQLRAFADRFKATSIFDDITSFYTQLSEIEDNPYPVRNILNDLNGKGIINWVRIKNEFP